LLIYNNASAVSFTTLRAKKLFDEAQAVLRRRGQPERKPKNEPQPFCGLISCASCGMMITAEAKRSDRKTAMFTTMSIIGARKNLKW